MEDRFKYEECTCAAYSDGGKLNQLVPIPMEVLHVSPIVIGLAKLPNGSYIKLTRVPPRRGTMFRGQICPIKSIHLRLRSPCIDR